MNRMVFTATQIAYHLALTITVKNDDEVAGVMIPLLPVTTLFFIVWQIRQLATRLQDTWQTGITAWRVRLTIALKLSVIFCKATAYGVGVVR